MCCNGIYLQLFKWIIMKRKIIIAVGTGFIGEVLIKHLLQTMK